MEVTDASFNLNRHIWQMGEVASLVKMAELGSPRLVLTEPRGVVGELGCFHHLCSRERASCSFMSFWVPLGPRRGVSRVSGVQMCGAFEGRTQILWVGLLHSWCPILCCPATACGNCDMGYMDRVLLVRGLCIKDRGA